MAEFRDYPIFLFQFHFEKTQYERRRITQQLSRTPDQIRFSNTFINHFVEPLRRTARLFMDQPVELMSFRSQNFIPQEADWRLFE
jgi:hypothetical protein